MQSEGISIARPLGNLGFTTHGRPVRRPTILGATTESVFDAPPSAEPDSEPGEVGGDSYFVAGYSGVIARNLKSLAFARSRALHWSRTLGEAVVVFRAVGGGLWELEDFVEAHVMSAGEFATAAFEADAARLEDAIASLDTIAMSVGAARKDAAEALKRLSEIDGAPPPLLAGAVRELAETLETRAWCVLVDASDDDMLGELHSWADTSV